MLGLRNVLRHAFPCALLAFATPAFGLECSFKQTFFSEKSRGSIAYIREASSVRHARSYYANWCNVTPDSTISDKKGRYLFALNNRSTVSKKPYFAVVKVFRRGPSSKIRPLLSFRRVGTWSDHTVCKFKNFSSLRGAWPRASRFEDNPVDRVAHASYSVGGCDLFKAWNGRAFGLRDLALDRNSAFLRNIPEEVAFSDSRQWSISMTAYAYGSVMLADRSGRFPIIAITRDDANDMVVEYFDSEGVYRLFAIRVE